MEWKKEYDVGIRDIDEQHQAIAKCISGIEHAATEQDGWSTSTFEPCVTWRTWPGPISP